MATGRFRDLGRHRGLILRQRGTESATVQHCQQIVISARNGTCLTVSGSKWHKTASVYHRDEAHGLHWWSLTSPVGDQKCTKTLCWWRLRPLRGSRHPASSPTFTASWRTSPKRWAAVSATSPSWSSPARACCSRTQPTPFAPKPVRALRSGWRRRSRPIGASPSGSSSSRSASAL